MQTPSQVSTVMANVPIGGVFWYQIAYYVKVDAGDAFDLATSAVQGGFNGTEAVAYYPEAKLALL